jgi:DNA (cytosine-5)-methyltransferase 1
VAQRRRRVFVVASARADFDPAAVLFEFDGVRRDTAPSREKGQAIAPTVTNGAPFSRTGNARVEAQAIIAPALAQCLTTGTGQRYDPETETILPVSTFSCGGIGAYTEDQTSATLLKSGQDLGNGCEALTVHPVMQPAYAIQGNMIGRADTAGPQGSGISEDVSFTLTKADQHAVAQPIPINSMNALRDADAAASTGCGIGQAGEAMYTLTKGHSHAVAQPIGCFKGGQGSAAGGIGYDEHISPTLGAADSGSNRTPALMQGMQVRRLTPVECERLQGFPDNYTDIKAKGKPTPDGPRYKALGNSWAVPVVRWIGERIARAT